MQYDDPEYETVDDTSSNEITPAEPVMSTNGQKSVSQSQVEHCDSGEEDFRNRMVYMPRSRMQQNLWHV